MFCPNFGKELADNMLYCPECGHETQLLQKTVAEDKQPEFDSLPHKSDRKKPVIFIIVGVLLVAAVCALMHWFYTSDNTENTTDPSPSVSTSPHNFQIKTADETTNEDGETTFINETCWINGYHIQDAEVVYQDQQWMLSLQLNEEGTYIFAQITQEHVNEYLPIYVNGDLVAAPYVQEPITDGKILLVGNFSKNELENLCTAALNSIP